MSRLINIAGQRFGRLVVLRQHLRGARNSRWECICDCGKTHITRAVTLRRGETKSCGCLATELKRARATTHGMSQKSPEYVSWVGMLGRCTNPANPAYTEYGGRGITVCARWQKFENFITDMGMKPTEGHSIDRWPDNNAGYAPGNCRWATRIEQANNRRPRRRNKRATQNQASAN